MDYNKDYYKELNLDKNASDDDIKKSFRKLALKYHPDKNNGDKNSENKFKTINEANTILSDSKLKQEYDTRSPHGKSYKPFNTFGGFGGFGGFSADFGSGSDFDFDINNIFNSIFGGNRRSEFYENLDISLNINLNLKQVYLDEKLSVDYDRFIHCENCNGTGADKNSVSYECEMCNGTGKNHNKKCEYCQGNGKIYNGECKTCNGEKVISRKSNITLGNISKIRSNNTFVQHNYGHQSKYYRDKIGKLLLNVIFVRNDNFEITDLYNLNNVIDVHYQDAIDGCDFIFKHIDDTELTIKIPPKTNNNNIICVKNKGLLKHENFRGDLYLKVNIIIDYNKI